MARFYRTPRHMIKSTAIKKVSPRHLRRTPVQVRSEDHEEKFKNAKAFVKFLYRKFNILQNFFAFFAVKKVFAVQS